MNQSQQLLLRAALFEEKIDASKFVEADWKQIFNLSDIQTVSSLVLDGIGMLPHSVLQIPFDKKMMLFVKMQRMEQINRDSREIDLNLQQIDCQCDKYFIS